MEYAMTGAETRTEMPGRDATSRVREAPPHLADPFSAMTPRFNVFYGWFARRFFRYFELPAETVERLRSLEQRGTVVYVMRYASRLDYFLMNTLFCRVGLRLSGGANGIHFYYYRPLREALRIVLRRLRMRGVGKQDSEVVHRLAENGESLFLFLRTARLRSRLWGRKRAAEHDREDLDVLGEVVSSQWDSQRQIVLVPLALFWRKGPRAERRFLNLAYGSQTRPSDFTKIASFLTTYRGLFIKVGEPIDLRAFIEKRRVEGTESVARKVRRSVMLFLYREEKVVEGPTLRPLYKVQASVLDAPAVRAAIEASAASRNQSLVAARRAAEKIFREIAANMNSTFLALLSVLVPRLFRRLFVAIEVSGIEKVAEYAKRHPLILAPSHRSYFDFVILSWLFYEHHLVPPHIAARDNMAFGPFGFIFRHAGAFFLRRSFGDPLYKEVFRAYIAYLVREGFTQEFFIEGGRSRTGKTLLPRLGVLTWNVESFLTSGQHDLFIVPIAITYERLVEERSLLKELGGGTKQQESVLGLLRARKLLHRRFGSVFVNLGEPISLAEALGAQRERFRTARDSETEQEKRRFVQALGRRVVERINWATVVNATSVAACALLGETRRGVYRSELVRRMREIIKLLRLQDAQLTPALERDQGDFHESIAFLVRNDLVRAVRDVDEEIFYFEEEQRRALSIYRNSILHYLVAPSVMARGLLRGMSSQALRQELVWWLDLFEFEFFIPRGEILAAHFDGFLDAFMRFGLLKSVGDELQTTELGEPYFQLVAAQTQAVIETYYALFQSVVQGPEWQSRKQLLHSAQESWNRLQLLGKVQRPEAAHPVTFGNATALLLARNILAEKRLEPDAEPVYTRGEQFEALTELSERLATAVAGR